MAEAAGLAVGIVALIGTFKDCVDLFLYISSAQSIARDYAILETKLEIERTLFLQWADRVRLLSPDQYDRRLDDPTKVKVLSAALGSIRKLLSESERLRNSYGLAPEPETESRGKNYQMVGRQQITKEAASAISGSRLIRFFKDFEALDIGSKDKSTHVSPIGKIRWAIQDKDKFEKLIQELSYFIAKLNELVPDSHERITAMINDDLKKENLAMIDLVYEASVNKEHAVAAIAKRNQQEKRVLQSLWFRAMDDRRYSIAPPHSQTFHWAIEPREASRHGGKWDNLSKWLQTGTGIYWVSGKAGSGKSTLMKYIHGHKTTQSLLEKWAGGCPLMMASFFFWYAGADEQKTQHGLSRALLFYILDKDPASMQDLLPSMWREAEVSKSDEIRPPSTAEMKHAFEELSNDHRKLQGQKFCFLIDGLDEYLGDMQTGISFVENLVKPQNIKVIVSSRPIPACVDAFSTKPQLHVHDLTKADITSYVDAEVGLHHYMKTLRRMEPTNALKVVEELVGKASGVFLWIILACRSVLEGFASSDYIPDILRRIDELPPELEDLFSHMLSKVDSRYQGHCAKHLRTCYQNKLIPNAPVISSMAMAIADHRNQGYLNDVRSKDLSINDRLLICEAFENRLRSHCCGLLEFVRPAPDHQGRCFCFAKYKAPHNTKIDSTVDFIHRSVFDFLSDPSTWQLGCLQINESCDPIFSLANISFQLLDIARDVDQKTIFMGHTILYAIEADRLSNANGPIIDILAGLGKLLTQYPSCGVLYIALELGTIHVLRAYQSREDPVLLRLSKETPFPLLYHALARPYINNWIYGLYMAHVDWDQQRLLETIEYVLSLGVSPNEEFKIQLGKQMTPWIYWLMVLREKIQRTASDIDIAILLINSGADLKVCSSVLGKPLSRFCRSISLGGENTEGKLQHIIELSETAEEEDQDCSSESEYNDAFEDAVSDFTNNSGLPPEEHPVGVGVKRGVSLDGLQQRLEDAKRVKL
ncbi:prion-inhibition and propagation-domain-containing protein [Hypoxylon rubiginosum]|uniref:Prion-inhibition and propagation-domain-containing protein n=1 Tax=Hypoxylon rubiginosum TaxID=110542 RepID=A0ACC0DIX2_9PEZI|nr:prion-inhibition and propagation-domain-containing protein [Hypoxylon rubiginosum]